MTDEPIGGLRARLRSLWRGARGRDVVEAEMAEEFRLHQELHAEQLMRAGTPPDEARRRARHDFGPAQQWREEGRAARGLHRLDALRVSWLDVKLGARMLLRHPGITVVGGLAFAFAIWTGAATFEVAMGVFHPTIPLPQGSRLVGLELVDATNGREEGRLGLDLLEWRRELRTVQELGAFRTVQRTLVTGEGRGEPVAVAEMHAAGFRLTRTPPLLGRTLVEADEAPGAAPALVLGHELWQRRFAGDSTIVGRTVQLGRTVHTVVGVMPAGFAFPVAHESWTPLRLTETALAPRAGPELQTFGRLAPGVSLEAAQRELAALGRRAAVDRPDTHEHLRPRVLPYARSIFALSTAEIAIAFSSNIPLVLLLVLICSNVALLMFARAATREAELVVRTALGASRARIVMQLFVEALVLGGAAALLGLLAARFGLRWLRATIESSMGGGQLPFWIDDRLSPPTLLYAAVLTVLGAVIAGVLPALKVTRGVGARLKQATAGGGGLRFGGVWTAVIVTQIAVTVAFPTVGYFLRRDSKRIERTDPGFNTTQVLAARLEMDREPPPGAPDDTTRAGFLVRYGQRLQELQRRLASEPGVVAVASGDRLPLMYHPHRLVEVDSGGAAPLRPEWPAYRVSAASVEPGFFDVMEAPVLAGRALTAADAPPLDAPPLGTVGAPAGAVLVNEPFVQLVLGGRNPIGRRLRYVRFEDREPRDVADVEKAPWYEIVGVVRDLGMAMGADVGQREGGDPKVAGIYHATVPGGVYPAQLAVHVRGDPAAAKRRLQQLTTGLDPTLRLYEVMTLDRMKDAELQFLDFWFRLLLMVSGIALVLSLAGIYAVMSFTVARRTREIGVRVALGASHARVLRSVFRRPILQVGGGVLAGAVLTLLLATGIEGGSATPRGAALLVGYVVLMFAVCLLACIVPTRRALAIEPTEALRAE